MITLELQPGIHRLPPVTEATRIVSTERWRAILEPADDSDSCVRAKADLRLEGCQVRCGTTDKGSARVPGVGIGVYGDHECGNLVLDDCWVHHCMGQGVFTHQEVSVRINHTLIERNGTHCQLDHGAYLKGWFQITDSLFLHNACYNLQAYPEASVGIVFRSVFYGAQRNHTIVYGGQNDRIAILQCTLFGDPPRGPDGTPLELHRSNLCFPDSTDGQGIPALVMPHYHLFQPQRPDVKAGAYDYEPDLCTFEQAKTLWRGGVCDSWGEHMHAVNPEVGHRHPFPLFPGDLVPQYS